MEASFRNLVFVGIGVARPLGMTPLPGVANSIAAMRDWANSQGYHTVTVTDDREPVTVGRLKTEFDRILASRIDRIIVYFVGHGFLSHPDQIWILSNGPDVNSGRISRDTLRSSLATYLAGQQISVISDACLESRIFQTGTSAVLEDIPGHHPRAFVDQIYSTLPNLPAFQFRQIEGKPPFCLFTSVLVDFLNGNDDRAFRLADGNFSQNVTTQTLYFSLPEAVVERGAELGVNQEPSILMGFPQGRDIYAHFPPRARMRSGDDHRGLIFDEEPISHVPPVAMRGAPGIEAMVASVRMREHRMPKLPPETLRTLINQSDNLNSSLVALVHHEGEGASLGFILNELPTGFQYGRFPDGFSGYWSPVFRASGDGLMSVERSRPRSLLTLSWEIGSSQCFCMAPTFDHLITTVQITDREYEASFGCTHLSWAPDYSVHLYSELTVEACRALFNLTEGVLRSADAEGLADKLRIEKHANPMIGIVCAYLYDLIGDSDSINRLCHFYVHHQQGIPFDIALLSGGQIRQSAAAEGWEVDYRQTDADSLRAATGAAEYLWAPTPAGTGQVAGVAPLIRAGWPRLASRQDSVLRGFAELESSLAPSPISTLVGENAKERAIELLRTLRFFQA